MLPVIRLLLTCVVRLYLFFLMIRRPPSSTPFPTRRSSDLSAIAGADYVVNEIQVGGYGATRTDFDIPARYGVRQTIDRKSTRLNSSHPSISYAVFCLKKKS